MPIKKIKYEEKIALYDGIFYDIPKIPDEKEIVNWDKKTKDQKFLKRQFLEPKEFEKLSRESQVDYLTQEYIWRTQGRWYFICGIPTYFPGDFDFYLNYWYMGADTVDGYPEYRHSQLLQGYFYDLVDNDDRCSGGMILSQKRFSKTEFSLSHLYNRASTTGKDDNFGMMSTDSKTARENLMRDRIVRSHNNIFAYLQPHTISNKTSKDVTNIKFTSDDGERGQSSQSLNNTIFYKPTKVDAFQGHKMKIVYVDEAPSIEELDFASFDRTTKQQLMLGIKIHGKRFYPATIESMKPKSVKPFKKLWIDSAYSSRDLNGRTISGMLRYFNPYWQGMEGCIDEYGNDMVEVAKSFIENQFEAADDEGKQQLRRQYPPTPEAAFDEVVGSTLEEDVVTMLKERKKQLEREPPENPIFCVKMYEKENEIGWTNIKYNINEFIIYEQVKPNVIYKVGIDSTNTDNTTGDSKGSKFAFTIVKGFEGIDQTNYTVVAEFARRPDKMEDCLMILYMACKMYNKYNGLVNGVLPERNVAGASFVATFFRQRMMEHLLMKEKGSTLYGFYRTGHVKETQIIRTNLFLRRYGNRIPSLPLIDDLLMVGKDNTDRADSLMGAITALGDFDKQEGLRKDPIIKKKMVTRIVNGRPTREWIDMVIGDDGKAMNANIARTNMIGRR